MHLRLLAVTAVSALALAACANRPKTPAVGSGQPPPPAAEGAAQRDEPPIDRAALTAQQELAAQAGDRVYFALDSHELDEIARGALQRQAAWLSANPSVRVRIEGHADERGTREYNLALGGRRASAVRQFLMSAGVSTARLETISYGKERPIDAGSGEAAWSRNRNAHTAVIAVSLR